MSIKNFGLIFIWSPNFFQGKKWWKFCRCWLVVILFMFFSSNQFVVSKLIKISHPSYNLFHDSQNIVLWFLCSFQYSFVFSFFFFVLIAFFYISLSCESPYFIFVSHDKNPFLCFSVFILTFDFFHFLFLLFPFLSWCCKCCFHSIHLGFKTIIYNTFRFVSVDIFQRPFHRIPWYWSLDSRLERPLVPPTHLTMIFCSIVT